jgi:pyruvate,orthophosphate dikinase
LNNAEGEDVVSGVRTPMTLDDLRLEQPTVYDNLVNIEKLLERHYRLFWLFLLLYIDLILKDIVFTVENEVLFILQTRRSPLAAVIIAVQEKLIIAERYRFYFVDLIDILFVYS